VEAFWPVVSVAPFLLSPTGYRAPANCSSSEALYEDESFSERGLAALVASKVYYHLQEYNESMVLALGAGKLFKLENGGEYEETIIGMSRTSRIISSVISC
jgi:hypothetical protein